MRRRPAERKGGIIINNTEGGRKRRTAGNARYNIFALNGPPKRGTNDGKVEQKAIVEGRRGTSLTDKLARGCRRKPRFDRARLNRYTRPLTFDSEAPYSPSRFTKALCIRLCGGGRAEEGDGLPTGVAGQASLNVINEFPLADTRSGQLDPSGRIKSEKEASQRLPLG